MVMIKIKNKKNFIIKIIGQKFLFKNRLRIFFFNFYKFLYTYIIFFYSNNKNRKEGLVWPMEKIKRKLSFLLNEENIKYKCEEEEEEEEENNDNIYFCEICENEYKTIKEMETHYNIEHILKCKECNKYCINKKLLEIHMTEKHDIFFQIKHEKNEKNLVICELKFKV
jgi:hypothetical protein